MTIVEAMALGKPVIVPSMGGHTDFISDETTFIVPANATLCNRLPCRLDRQPGTESPNTRISGWVFNYRMTHPPRWTEMDVGMLREVMWRVYANDGEREEKGRAAREYICKEVTWRAAGKQAVDRIHTILGLDKRKEAAKELANGELKHADSKT